jgi:hypothetical protein
MVAAFSLRLASLVVFLALLRSSHAFTPAMAKNSLVVSSQLKAVTGYIPDGLTAEEYKRIKAEDQKKVGKDLARVGPRGFKSRSMQAWQEAYEAGMGGHTFAPLNYQEKLKKGLIRREDVPYMVRGGSWDNSDVYGAKRVPWLKTDRIYANGGYKKEQSVSILGSGPGFNWTGERRSSEGPRKIVPGLS